MRKFTKVAAILVAVVAFGVLYNSVSNDYDTCRANGNSVNMCTGRG
ncbi:hypothetical protein pEaSNUABM6_00085 [Erwinia phage pEa_SNUABM_6]|nr:hypothetical protein pEaSNUABM6_00085 [Erwinia phage pEa_SNUABM_6]